MRIANNVLVLLVALQRLYELRISRRNRERMRAAGIRPAADPVFVSMVLSHVVLLAGSAFEPWLLDRPFLPAIGIPALVVFLTAQALRVWVVRSLGEHWNVRIMESRPRGVVTRGPYRYVRHPNYTVLLLEVTTLPLIHSAWITWVLTQALHTPVLLKRIRDEERVLHADPAYVAAMGDKPRFVPRLLRSAGTR